MARKIGIVTLLMLTTCPAVSWALGLGEIDLQSALNQPLQADIAIIGASAEELGGLEVHLASQDAFRRLGLDRPAYLSALRFNVMRNSAGKPVLRISSREPVTEPFVTFLIEAKWARGSLLREYTVLLDPPTFVPQAAPAPPPAAVPAPSTTRETQTSGTVLRQAPEQETAAPRPLGKPPAGAPYAAPPGDYRTERGDTLWRIAERYRPDGVTVNQMMIAMYEANPEAFGGNINRLRAGSILRVPDAEQLSAVRAADADFAVTEHMKSWHPGSGMVGERIAPKLQLVPPRDSGADTGRGPGSRTGDAEETVLRQEVEQLQRQLDSAEDRIQVQDSQMAALQQQLAEARQRLSEMTGEPVEPVSETETETELAGEPLDEAPGETVPVAGETEVQGGEPEQEPEPVVEKTPTPAKVVTPVREESLLDKVLGWLFTPMAFIALGAIAVLAALLVFLRIRQRGQSEEEPWQQYDLDESVDDLFKEEPAESSTETLPTPPGSRERESFLVHEQPATDDTASIDTGTFRGTTTGSGLEAAAALLDEEEQALDRVPSIQESEEGQEESDPMAEADFHMAYGLYDQAADILRSALDRSPSNRELQMKLAEVYFVWGNQDEFKSMAEKLSANRSDGDWDKILIMGKQLLPDDPLFSEMPGAGGRGGVDLALEATQVGGIVDLELGSGSFDRPTGASAVDLDLGDALDFAGDTQETPAVEGEDGTQPGLEALDFDLGGESGRFPSDLARTVETPRAEEFDIGSDYGEETSATPTERTAEIDLDDLGLDVNLDDSFIGRAPDAAGEDSDATGVRVAPDFGRDTDDDTAATGLHAAGIIGDDEETMLARFDDGDAGSTAILERRGSGDARSENVDFDIGGDFDSTDAGTDLTRELTDTETLSAGDVPGGLRDTAEMTGIHRAGELEATAEVPALPDEDLDLDLGNLSDVLDEGETREMREGLGDTMEVLGVGEVEDEELDLDIGESYEDESGSTNTMEMTDMTMPEAEALTLSEIGTKLDLARAYMDMGDPDGARSILQEVMEEGDNAQQADAKRLLDTLP